MALVTGGAVRVGQAITRALATAGYAVWVHHHRSAEAADELQRAHPISAEGQGVLGVVAADLRSPDDRRTLVAQVTAADGPRGGRLDLLVNNAASFERGAFLERDDADLERVLGLNLVAPLSLARRLAGALEASRGCIVNITDVASYHPWPDHLDHCISKAGLRIATEGLAVELASRGIRVNAVAPGTVAWPEGAHFEEGEPGRAAVESKIPLGRIGSPDDVAGAVLFLAGARHITGQSICVDGGRLAAIAGKHGEA